MDARDSEDKQKVSWTHALRQIVINCYKYHGREDLLPVFNEEEAAAAGPGAGQVQVTASAAGSAVATAANQSLQRPLSPPDKKPTIIHNVVANNANNTSVVRFLVIKLGLFSFLLKETDNAKCFLISKNLLKFIP